MKTIEKIKKIEEIELSNFVIKEDLIYVEKDNIEVFLYDGDIKEKIDLLVGLEVTLRKCERVGVFKKKNG